MFILTACPNDDDDDNMSSNSTNSFAGYWEIPNINAAGGITYRMMLYSEGIMKGSTDYVSGKNWGSMYNWTYNSDTNILATSASYGNVKPVNLQWQITMKSTDNWTGLALYESKNGTCVANRNLGEKALNAILVPRVWVKENDSGGTLTFNGIRSHTFRENNNSYEGYDIYLSTTYKDAIYYYSAGLFVEGQFDTAKDIFTASCKRVYGDNSVFSSITIEHPYSFYNIKIHLQHEVSNNDKENFDYYYKPKV